jgi:hypothetical protein
LELYTPKLLFLLFFLLFFLLLFLLPPPSFLPLLLAAVMKTIFWSWTEGCNDITLYLLSS